VKVARTVLRGPGASNVPRLPDSWLELRVLAGIARIGVESVESGERMCHTEDDNFHKNA
jgi:hypothetical protein